MRGDIVRLVKAADLELVNSATYAFLPRNPLYRMPRRLATSESFARTYDVVDGGLPTVLCQNHCFVARRQR
jgi:hypothetical protein